jgi:hypothetical protein
VEFDLTIIKLAIVEFLFYIALDLGDITVDGRNIFNVLGHIAFHPVNQLPDSDTFLIFCANWFRGVCKEIRDKDAITDSKI